MAGGKVVLFDIDQFNKPKELQGVDAEASLIATLFFMKPGTHPVYHKMGFDIGRYRFQEIEENVITIQNEFRIHCATYLPDIYIDKIEVQRAGEKLLTVGVALINGANNSQNTFVIKVTEDNGQYLHEILK